MEFLFQHKHIKPLNFDEYKRYISSARCIEQDGSGPKVYLLDDARYLKLFRLKRLLSSALIYPHALRFYQNSLKLQDLNIQTVKVDKLFAVNEIKRHGIIYQALEGVTVRDFLKQNTPDPDFYWRLGAYLAHLHHLGIYFRSVHFGNIIITPSKQFGLIDIADMKLFNEPLSYLRRLRNFKHFIIRRDIELVSDVKMIQQGYLQQAQINNPKFVKQLAENCQYLMHRLA